MREVSRTIVVAHRVIRPLAGARQLSEQRAYELQVRAIAEGDTIKWAKIIGAKTVKPFATTHYQQALEAASWITGRKIIGAGLESIVAEDGFGTDMPVTKYATHVNGQPEVWSCELSKRQEIIKNRLGNFILDTTYEPARLIGSQKPSMVLMRQPKIEILADGHEDPDVAEQRDELYWRLRQLADVDRLYLDVIAGHGNVVVYDNDGIRQLTVLDTPAVHALDHTRPFVPYLPNSAECAGWIESLAPAN